MDRTGWKRDSIIEWFSVVEWTDHLGDISSSFRRRVSSVSIAKKIILERIWLSLLMFYLCQFKVKDLASLWSYWERDDKYSMEGIEFLYQIPLSQQKDLTPCPKCFRELVLLEEMWTLNTLTSFVRFYFVLIYLTYS